MFCSAGALPGWVTGQPRRRGAVIRGAASLGLARYMFSSSREEAFFFHLSGTLSSSLSHESCWVLRIVSTIDSEEPASGKNVRVLHPLLCEVHGYLSCAVLPVREGGGGLPKTGDAASQYSGFDRIQTLWCEPRGPPDEWDAV